MSKINTSKLKLLEKPENTFIKVRHYSNLRDICLQHFATVYGTPIYVSVAEVFLTEEHPLVKNGIFAIDPIDRGAIFENGISMCGPYDQPNRKFGYIVAYNRAVKRARELLDTYKNEMVLKTNEVVDTSNLDNTVSN